MILAACSCCNMESLADDIHAVWPEGAGYVQTRWLLDALIEDFPERWSRDSHYGRELTAQRLGRFLSATHGIRSRRDHSVHRGYCIGDIEALWAVRAGG